MILVLLIDGFKQLNYFKLILSVIKLLNFMEKVIELRPLGIFSWIFEYQKLYVIFGERTNVRFFN
jgi:hypothetical protein